MDTLQNSAESDAKSHFVTFYQDLHSLLNSLHAG